MTTLKPARLGTISHATLNPEHLLRRFSSALEDQITLNGGFLSLPENFPMRDRLAKLLGDAQDAYQDDGETLKDEQDAAEMVDELIDALEEFAPPYCYFGATEGDGSDFGFWPSRESIDELPTESEREPGDDYKEVNDHGNVTIYGGDGSVLLEIV